MTDKPIPDDLRELYELSKRDIDGDCIGQVISGVQFRALVERLGRTILHHYEAHLLIVELEQTISQLRQDKERLMRIGALLPLILESLPWGAYKGALMEDGDLKAAIALAAREEKP